MTLEEADMILMGTPSGVGPVKPGDTITCGITNISKEYKFAVANRSLESKL
jgi:acylpyruvate hydrolase